MEYECPECGAPLPADAKICNACKAVFDWEEDEEETVDELLEEITTSMEPEDAEEVEDAEEAEPEPSYDPSPEMAEALSSDEAMEVPEDEAPMALEGPVTQKKVLSILGMAFAALTVVSVIGLMVVLNYDVWINGDAENNIGDTQMMYVYLAVVAVIVCIMLVVVDLVRNRKAA